MAALINIKRGCASRRYRLDFCMDNSQQAWDGEIDTVWVCMDNSLSKRDIDDYEEYLYTKEGVVTNEMAEIEYEIGNSEMHLPQGFL